MSAPCKYLLALLLSSAVSTGATAQAQQEPTTDSATQEQLPSVSDEKVSAFASAYVDMQIINQQHSQKMQNLGASESAAEAQQDTQQKMRDVILSTGLTVTEYRDIANLANESPELQKRINTAINRRSTTPKE